VIQGDAGRRGELRPSEVARQRDRAGILDRAACRLGEIGRGLKAGKLGGLCRPPNYAERAPFPQGFVVTGM